MGAVHRGRCPNLPVDLADSHLRAPGGPGVPAPDPLPAHRPGVGVLAGGGGGGGGHPLGAPRRPHLHVQVGAAPVRLHHVPRPRLAHGAGQRGNAQHPVAHAAVRRRGHPALPLVQQRPHRRIRLPDRLVRPPAGAPAVDPARGPADHRPHRGPRTASVRSIMGRRPCRLARGPDPGLPLLAGHRHGEQPHEPALTVAAARDADHPAPGPLPRRPRPQRGAAAGRRGRSHGARRPRVQRRQELGFAGGPRWHRRRLPCRARPGPQAGRAPRRRWSHNRADRGRHDVRGGR